MLKQFEDKMQKSLDSMTNDFMTIRAGRANPHVLDKVKVDYYGVATSSTGWKCFCARGKNNYDSAMGAKLIKRD